jgi:hypothetical protein
MGDGTARLSAVVASVLLSGALVRATEVSHNQSARKAVALTARVGLCAMRPG